MGQKQDSPGVYIPPPLLYVLIFLLAIFLQNKFAIEDRIFHFGVTKILGVLLVICSLYFLVTSLSIFFKTKNTLIPFKPASSLQTNGVFHISRNPMYVGLAIMYLGITCLIGNWWNVLLFPILIFIVQETIIKKEEKYLERAFKDEFSKYKTAVRRWI